MSKHMEYMNLEQFAKTFMDAMRELPNSYFTELFGRLAQGILKFNREDTNQEMSKMPDATKQCFQQLVNAFNDNGPEAKEFLEMAAAVSSIAVPTPKYLMNLLDIIRQGGVTDQKLTYEYLSSMKNISREVLLDFQYKNKWLTDGKEDDHRKIIHETAHDLAHHSLSTAYDKIDHCRMIKYLTDEKVAVLVEAANKVKDDMLKAKDANKIEEIINHDFNYILNIISDYKGAQFKQVLTDLGGALQSAEDRFNKEANFSVLEAKVIQPTRNRIEKLKSEIAEIVAQKTAQRTQNFIKGTSEVANMDAKSCNLGLTHDKPHGM